MKKRTSEVVLTPEQKAMAYTPEQIGEALYAKLKDDPHFALMSILCRNSGRHLAGKVEYYEKVNTKPQQIMLSYDNAMWTWENFDVIALTVDPGYRDDQHRILQVRVVFPDMSGKLMSIPMLSAPLDEILAFLRSPEFGPEQMMTLDRIDTAMGRQD